MAKTPPPARARETTSIELSLVAPWLWNMRMTSKVVQPPTSSRQRPQPRYI
jgi:hypothetical protein